MSVYYLVQKLDVALFGWMKQRWEKGLGWRLGASLLVTQLIDTVLFTFLGLYGLVASLFDVIVVSFAVKALVIGVSSSVAAFSKRWVKHVPV